MAASGGRWSARVRTALGWATGDRREEAKGKLEQLEDDDTPESQTSASAALDQAELDVRSDHGDLAPSAQPADHPMPMPPEDG